jgi:HlyD family secretion protein
MATVQTHPRQEAPVDGQTIDGQVIDGQALVETVVVPKNGENDRLSPASMTAQPSMTAQRDRLAQFQFLAEDDTQESEAPGRSRTVVIAVAAVGGVLLLAAVAAALLIPRGPDHSKLLTAPVTLGDLVITVTAKGNLESANSKNVKCEVESTNGSKIRWIIDNGEKVTKGTKLVEFDKSALDEQIKTQEINLKTAGAVRDQAKNDYATAAEAVKEYEEGTFKQEVAIAKQNLTIAENSLQHGTRMFNKGYISQLQLETMRFERDKADMAVNTLEKYTKTKMLIDLKGKLATAKTKMESEDDKYKLEQSKLARLKEQMDNCVILAPQDGMVEYAVERNRWGGGQQTTIEVGSVIPLGRDILRMPDLTQMQAKVMVNETKVERIKPGLKAVIKLAQGIEYNGVVESVANQADQKAFFAAAVTEFPVIVRITDPLRGNDKPGMSVDAVITVDDGHRNATRVPVTAVIHNGNESLCWVKTRTGAQRRVLKLRTNGDKSNPSRITDDSFYAVEEGLTEGEQVVVNPGVIPEAKVAEQAAKEAREKAAKEKKEKEKEAAEKAKTAADGGAKKGQEGGAKGAGKQFSSDWWKAMDKNKDGKLSRDEATGRMADGFDNMDKNKDGFVDEGEIQAAMEMRKKFSGAGSGAAGSGAPKSAAVQP